MGRPTFIVDTEEFPNCFQLVAEATDSPIRLSFEISDYRNDSEMLYGWLRWMADNNGLLIGFNFLNFDGPIIHTFMKMGGKASAKILYDKAMAIIHSQDSDKFAHQVFPSDRDIDWLCLLKIRHYDNFARATGLKALEFSMRMDNISDLPFPVGTVLNKEQCEVLMTYCQHDVKATKMFYFKTLDMIQFREELTAEYGRDMSNHNDVKIGKEIFQIELEKSGVQCYKYGANGRQPMQTLRPVIRLVDAILPWIEFQQPEFNRILNWLKQQTIRETNGIFKDLTATVHGFEFVFGLGGIHGAVSNEIVEVTNDTVIESRDVASMYPNIAIANRFYPEHLGEVFCDIYKRLYEQRKTYAKGTPKNAALKLSLNGTFGASNDQFSVFFDPLFTMRITLNGQMLLCLLMENLMRIPSFRLLSCNTDGVDYTIKKSETHLADLVCKWWEDVTKLELEKVNYSKIAIRDCNNYLAVYDNGKVKRKGCYEWDVEYHQNASSLVIPKVAEKVLTDGAPIAATLRTYTDIFDYCLRIKVPRNSLLVDGDGVVLQNTTRYYVSTEGVELFKMMPPLPGKGDEWRRFSVEKGRKVCVCNDIADAVLPIDYSFYENEIEKITLGLR